MMNNWQEYGEPSLPGAIPRATNLPAGRQVLCPYGATVDDNDLSNHDNHDNHDNYDNSFFLLLRTASCRFLLIVCACACAFASAFVLALSSIVLAGARNNGQEDGETSLPGALPRATNLPAGRQVLCPYGATIDDNDLSNHDNLDNHDNYDNLDNSCFLVLRTASCRFLLIVCACACAFASA